ncbi:hypothetical protein EVAR_101805_1 [Eumeta japonica]|uniref:Gustatory receptor n=1 Tax=Eumeta variegata TaxID=151549 RepID=A0A4C1SMS9_EUMVA|nr:hypothetical protein EVAR_101805_1 [Eumeta japonica]
MFFGENIETIVPMLPLVFVNLVTDLLQSGRFVYFGLVWFRMKVLREALEKEITTNVFLTTNEYNVFERRSPLTYLSVHTVILDASTLIKSTMNLPALTVYLLSAFIECFQAILFPCLPGLFTERTSMEVDKIKRTLLHRLIDTFDSPDPEHQEIEQFLQYVESRPYQYSVWGLFDVGSGLLLGLIGLSINYFIVVIQFTHLF